MNATLRSILTLAMVQVVVVGSVRADQVKPSLAAVRGEVLVQNKKVGPPPVSVKTGSTIKSGPNSGAILTPVPGQTIFIDQNSIFEIKTCEMTAGSGDARTRHVVCALNTGHVHCSIAHPKSGSSNLELITSKATMSAHGTSWSTWVDDSGVHTAVYAGVVTVTFGNVVVDVRIGQVATLTGEGDAEVLEVLDLKTGIIVRYSKGSPEGQQELASAAQIKVARDLFASGLGAFKGTASDADHLEFSQVVNEINKLLAANQLPPIIPPLEWQLWPNWFKIDPNLQPLASPEQPVN